MDQGLVKRSYGRFPEAVRPHAIQLYEAISTYSRVSAYQVLADAFGCTDKRVQQVVYEQRKLQEARHSEPEPVIETESTVRSLTSRPEPGPDGTGSPSPL